MLKERNQFWLCSFLAKTVKEHFANAVRIYYSNIFDMILAVKQGRTDGYEDIR